MAKAQSAMEFLVTYGWVLTAVLSIIGLLFYFGVMNPKMFITEQCISSYPFFCGKPFVNNSEVNIMLLNKAEYGIFFNTSDIQLPYSCNSASLCDDLDCFSTKVITSNSKILLKLNCNTNDKSIIKYNFKVYITNLLSGLREELNFYIIGKVNK